MNPVFWYVNLKKATTKMQAHPRSYIQPNANMAIKKAVFWHNKAPQD